jgi:hypothetical protein
MVVDSAAIGNRPLRNLALLVEHKDATPRGPDSFQRELQDPLQQFAQIELSGQLTADGVEQVK